MYCWRCGQEVDERAYVCTNCGCLVGERYGAPGLEKKPTNGMAVAGFICAFISPLLGWIFGGIGLSRAAQRNGKGKALSMAAIIIASIMFGFGLAILL